MSLPTINATDSLVAPVREEAVEYNLWWLQQLQGHFPDGNGDGSVTITLRRYRKREDGSNEFAPRELGNVRTIRTISSVLTKAASGNRPKLAAALVAILEAAQEDFDLEAAAAAEAVKEEPAESSEAGPTE